MAYEGLTEDDEVVDYAAGLSPVGSINFNPDGSIVQPLADPTAPPSPNAAKAELLARAETAPPIPQVTEGELETQKAAEEPPRQERRSGDRRLAGLTGERRRGTAGFVSSLEESQREERAAFERYQAAETEKAAVVRDHAELEYLKRQRFDEKLADQQQAKQKYYKESEADLAKQLKYSKTSHSREKFDRLTEQASDPSLPEETRKAARASLKQAEELDPDRILGGASSRVAAGIFTFLGSIGAALTGGSNSALEIIEGAIDRDIDAQRHNFAKKRQGYLDEKQARGEKLDFMESEERNLVVQKLRMFEAAEAKVKVAVARSDSEMVKQRGMQLSAVMEQKHQALIHDASMTSVKERMSMEVQQQQLGMQREGLGLQKLRLGAQAGQTQRDQVLKANALRATGLAMDPESPVPISTEDIKKIRVETSNYKVYRNALQGIVDLARSGEWSSMNPTDRRIMTGRVTAAMLKLKNVEKAGALDKGLQEISGEVIPDPSELLTLSDPAAVVEDAIARADQEFNLYAGNLGLQVLPPPTKFDPSFSPGSKGNKPVFTRGGEVFK